VDQTVTKVRVGRSDSVVDRGLDLVASRAAIGGAGSRANEDEGGVP
jgi:hypothetical protein